jgi:ribonuclease BN (tRNA processing enzyme)
VEIQVLGKSPSWQDAGGACSGYLVRQDDFSLLVDCGAGVLGKLRAVQDHLALDAVLITHLHADHVLDLVPFSYGLRFSPRRGEPVHQPALHLPPGGCELLRRLGGVWHEEDLILSAFTATEYPPKQELALGPMSVRFCEVPHFTDTFACEIAAAGARFTFGADCAPNDVLPRFAGGTDLLMVEASLAEPESEGQRGHMTPFEAGELGRRADAGRLVITHFSDELDPGWVRAEARRGFGAEVVLAEEGLTFTV